MPQGTRYIHELTSSAQTCWSHTSLYVTPERDGSNRSHFPTIGFLKGPQASLRCAQHQAILRKKISRTSVGFPNRTAIDTHNQYAIRGLWILLQTHANDYLLYYCINHARKRGHEWEFGATISNNAIVKASSIFFFPWPPGGQHGTCYCLFFFSFRYAFRCIRCFQSGDWNSDNTYT